MKKINILLISTVVILTSCSKKEENIKNETKYEEKTTTYKKDNTTEVLIDKEIKKEDVVRVYKHGDHWHVFTKDGKEHITYKDPEKLSSGESINVVNVVSKNKLSNISVVSIKKHGDHWHIYTNNGEEFLTYEDPSTLYPNIKIGVYEGNHFEHKHNINVEKIENKINKEENSLEIVNLLGKPKVNKNDIVKILKHGDHYHIFDSKGNEGIVYENPKKYYPNAILGNYEGSHGQENNKENKISKWPKGVTKIIDHKDHWHLFIGDKEIAVVSENPRPHYPNAEIIEEEITEYDEINDEEVFRYEDIKEKLIDSVLPYLSNNLKAMENFGNLNTTIPVYGSNGEKENIFYWLHGDHYHAISIKQIIQKAKSGEFGNNSAKDVVAVLKYKILNPNANLEPKVTVDFEEVKKYLMNYYKITEKNDVMYIYGNIDIHKNGQTKTIHLNKFEKKDGKIIPKKELPVFEEKNRVEEEENTETNIEKKETSKENIEEISNKEQENIKKIAKILNIEEDDVLDVIYDTITDVKIFKVADLEVNDDKTITLNGKKYKLETT